MKVIRHDIGTLAPPVETSQGFLKVEGHASRVGVFTYRNKDGSERRELRLPEDVFRAKALKGYEGAPITNNHPAKKVTARTARSVSVGHVQGSARKDGDHVATTMMVTDEDAIAALRKGKRGLSTGYEVDLEETPGVHPIYGRYDAIQRNLVINHLAIVDFPRAGDSARVRMDAADMREDEAFMVLRSDAPLKSADVAMTDSVDGHQHSINRKGFDNGIRTSGTTSAALSEGADHDHSHEWFLDEDGETIVISENAGHTHEIAEFSDDEEADVVTEEEELNTDGRSAPGKKGRAMKTGAAPQQKNAPKKEGAEQPKPAPKPTPAPHRADNDPHVLAEAATRITQLEEARDAAEKKLARETARADAAEGQVAGLRARLEEAESDRTDSELIEAKDLRIRELEEENATLKTRADSAEDPERLQKAVAHRVQILKLATPLIGEERLDEYTDREIMLAALEKVGRTDMADKSDEFVSAIFGEMMGRRGATQRQIDKLREFAPPPERTDAAEKSGRQQYIDGQRNGFKPAGAFTHANTTNTKGA